MSPEFTPQERESLQQAAQGFEQAENWLEAAECWVKLGKLVRAAALYERMGDLEHAVRLRLEAQEYFLTLDLCQRWEREVKQVNTGALVQALLGQAACHHLGAASPEARVAQKCSLEAGELAYQRARALLTDLDGRHVSAVRAWTALGEFGVWCLAQMERP